MKNIYKIISYLLLALLTATSCIYDDVPEADDEAKVYLVLSLTMGSRTRMNELDDEYIDPSTLAIKLYDANGSFKTDVKVRAYTQNDARGEGEILGEVSKDKIKEGEYSLVVTANANDGELYDKDGYFKGNALPMWGRKEFKLSTKTDIRQDIGKIYLVRALAKIEVKLAEEIKDRFELKGVVLSGKIPTKYNISPPDDSEIYTENELSEEVIDGFFNPVVAVEDDFKSFKFTETDNGYELFVPEFEVDDDHKFIIEVYDNRSKKTVKYSYKLKQDFSKLEQNRVIRSHKHIFTISQVGEDLGVNFKIRKWIEKSQFDDYTDNVIVKKAIEWKGIYHVSWSEAKIEMKENSLKCSFQISAPEGSVWYASFKTISGDLKSFKFEKNNKKTNIMTGRVGVNKDKEMRTGHLNIVFDGDEKQKCKAELVVAVRIGDKTKVVDLVHHDSDDPKTPKEITNWTILHEI